MVLRSLGGEALEYCRMFPLHVGLVAKNDVSYPSLYF